MADIICPKCEKAFDHNNKKSLVTRTAAAAATGVTGGWFGASIGIVAGPLGGISGLVPGAVIGGITGWFAADQFRKCPHCENIFKT